MYPFSKHLGCVAALAVGFVVAACGGSGGADPQAKPQSVENPSASPGTFYVLGQKQLPGHLAFGNAIGVGVSYDLQTGIGTRLPAIEDAPDKTDWDTSAGGKFLLRVNHDRSNEATLASVFSTDDLSKPLRSFTLPANVSSTQLSKDGRYLLTYLKLEDDRYGRLAIFDTFTGKLAKGAGSAMDGALRLGEPAAWRPDGRYVYFVRNAVYVASPTKQDDERLFTLNELPFNNASNDDYITLVGSMSVSPDGTQLAFSWNENSRDNTDTHIWIVDMNGRNAHRMTRVADIHDGSSYNYMVPTWSPDGQYVAGIVSVGGINAAPVFPDSEEGAWEITGATGCYSPVFVLAANARDVAIPRVTIDKQITLKVRSQDGKKGEWLTTCGAPSLSWTP